ncbi:MAG: hypothetical protein AAFX09_08520 [Pseudomonadota bacterium]
MREYLQRDGLWGWGGGAGCIDRASAWLVEGDTVEVFRNNRLMDRYRLEKRVPLYDNRLPSGEGALAFVDWTFIGRNPDNLDQMGRQELMFAIRGGPGRPTALVPRNQRTFTDAQTRDRSQVDEPYQGDRLVHCDEYATFQN